MPNKDRSADSIGMRGLREMSVLHCSEEVFLISPCFEVERYLNINRLDFRGFAVRSFGEVRSLEYFSFITTSFEIISS